MKPVLVDTGCIVALLDRSERNHARCAQAVADIQGPLVTCEAVIAESCYLLRSLKGAPEAVVQNVARGVFQIPFHLDEHAPAVVALLRKYRTVPMDLADACLVHLASLLETGKILTLDQDFAIYRWRRNRAFENLLAIS
ncbi:MAG: PIN domain-containing protein [Deltaproteobacteria bacterium]|nr:PIN domain-containing protein [Deltaproteobacteria bacterium]